MSDKRFLVTARKYRPQLFGELVAQEHITATLKNAIRLDRLAHAYLFTGPRGVGKTTAARILAKAINCTTDPDKRTEAAEPCRECDSCRSFEEGRNLNIIEIDAASNNKVDDIRELRETVRIPPQGNRKKVYIVDEVHMLTTQAFNALLKTLEEPPAHALFIFATTEPHKVLATIQSRCQRFDFRRIPVQETVSRLQEICESEGITADDGSLMLIARKGDGALRDALSVFDQAVSLCGSELQQSKLVEALGVVSEELFFEVTDHVSAANVPGMITLVDGVVGSGYDLQEFLDGLAEHLRNLLVAKTMPDTSLIEASDATRARYAESAESLSQTQILRLLASIDRTVDSLRTARQPRLRLELALIKMATLPSTSDLRAALSQIQELAAAEASNPAPKTPVQAPVPAPRQAQPAAMPKPSPAVATAPPRTAPPVGTSAPPRSAPPVVASEPPLTPPPAGTKPAAPVKETAAQDLPVPSPPTPPARPTPSVPAPAPRLSPPALTAPTTGFGTSDIFGKPALGKPARKPNAPDQQASAASDTEVAVMEPPSRGDSIEDWETVVEAVTASRIHLGALLSHADAEIRELSTVTLVVPDEFHARVLQEARDEIVEGLASIGRPEVQQIDFEINGTIRQESDVASMDVDPQQALNKICEDYPAMRLLMERFGGEIVW
ncbi:MAG: DNA polymerase-3 subunit gamma/tau [Rhodothermales bacterium]|jgi:DNA polymerase-3 subunit gamma/tau